MFLLAILLSLVLEKLLPVLDRLRSIQWFLRFAGWLRGKLQPGGSTRGTLAALLIILLPTLAVAGVQAELDKVHWLFSFALSLAVLIYSLGPHDLHRQVHAYLDAHARGDSATAETVLADLLTELPEDEETRTQALVDAILVQTHERVMAVFFWFVVLGPMGAILYRLTAELIASRGEEDDPEFWTSVSVLHIILAWLPAHLAALGFAMVGSFTHALQAWREAGPNHVSQRPICQRYVIRTGRAAMELEKAEGLDKIRETLGLCDRSLIAWVTVLSLLTLAGLVV